MMRARRCMDGLLDKVYLKTETEGVTGSGVRLWVRSLEGGDSTSISFSVLSYYNASQGWLRYAQPTLIIDLSSIVPQFVSIFHPRFFSLLRMIATLRSLSSSAPVRITIAPYQSFPINKGKVAPVSSYRGCPMTKST